MQGVFVMSSPTPCGETWWRGAEKVDFGRLWNHGSLSDDDAVKNLSTSDGGLSNGIIGVVLT